MQRDPAKDVENKGLRGNKREERGHMWNQGRETTNRHRFDRECFKKKEKTKNFRIMTAPLTYAHQNAFYVVKMFPRE
jgi:hypothetical protein